jgi:hypothetical protein
MPVLFKPFRRTRGQVLPTLQWWEVTLCGAVLIALGIILGIITTPYPINSTTTYTRTHIPPPLTQTSIQTVTLTPAPSVVTSVSVIPPPAPVTVIQEKQITQTETRTATETIVKTPAPSDTPSS